MEKNVPIFFLIQEIKLRFLYTFLSFVCFFFIFFNFKEQLLFLFINPFLLIKNEKFYFIYTNVFEILILELNFSLILSLFCLIPLITYQLFNFYLIILKKYELNFFLIFYFKFFIYFLILNFFFYNFFFPLILDFSIHFELKNTENLFQILLETKIDDYIKNLNFCFLNILFFILFNFFFIIIIYNFTFTTIIKIRKFIYLLIFIIVFIFLSPPDFFIQIILLLPFLIFYEFCLFQLILNQIFKKIWKC